MEIFELNKEGVNNVVSGKSVGCYTLGKLVKHKFVPEYVGRSDRNIHQRLLQHVSAEKHSHFSVELTDNLFEAYRLECRGWHSLGMTNKIHPAAPNHLGYVCPYCQVRQEFGGDKQ